MIRVTIYVTAAPRVVAAVAALNVHVTPEVRVEVSFVAGFMPSWLFGECYLWLRDYERYHGCHGGDLCQIFSALTLIYRACILEALYLRRSNEITSHQKVSQ